LREQGDRPLVALGFSNGANMAAALLLLHPEVLSGAVLLRANLPVTPDRPPPPDSYRGVPVLIANARRDPYRREGDTEGLAQVLESAGADVEIRWSPGGHELGPGEIDIVRDWLARWRTRWTSATVTR
jgi:predicted esterase